MRRRVIAVIGDGAASSELCALAEEIGRLLVDRGFRVVTGGLGGVMEAASRGARSSERYREGDVVGILPGADPESANDSVDIAIPTGMGIARNALVVLTAEAIIAIGGRSGTLSEIATAWQLGRPVVGVEVDGWSGKLAGCAVDDRRSDAVIPAKDAQTAVDAVLRALSGSGVVADTE